ncbi:MAG TPA: TIM barrel protein [bacterium]|nr:TIM barrel protein [bacterium]
MTETSFSRRSFMAAAGSIVTISAINPCRAPGDPGVTRKGRIRQSVSRWCYDSVLDWDSFAKECAEMGLVGIDLVEQKFWPIVKKCGLISTMVPGAGGISDGTNDPANHAKMLEQFKANIKAAADNGLPNVITFSGNRRGKSDEEGLENSVPVLQEAVRIAEDHGVTICMELLNSKVDHKDYQCDHTAWGVELCKRVGSPRFKLLYDIYHMQIMEGDVIRTIRENIDFIGHFHTGGNPGRKDLDDTQELNYKPIMEAIAALTDEKKFNGYVAHEFVPKNKMDSLRAAVELCDV